MLTGAIVSVQVAGVETRDQGSTGDEGDHLDDWFTRRLESHGISARGGKSAIPRVLVLIGLAIALLGMFWALSAVQNATKSSSPPATTSQQSGNGNPSSNSNGGTSTAPTLAAWQKIPVDVLNGFGGPNAASQAAAQLRTAGFKVASTGNGGTQTAYTVVVFTAGHRSDAHTIAKRLHKGVVPVAAATGVPATAVTDGVAVVVGPNGLPSNI